MTKYFMYNKKPAIDVPYVTHKFLGDHCLYEINVSGNPEVLFKLYHSEDIIPQQRAEDLIEIDKHMANFKQNINDINDVYLSSDS